MTTVVYGQRPTDTGLYCRHEGHTVRTAVRSDVREYYNFNTGSVWTNPFRKAKAE